MILNQEGYIRNMHWQFGTGEPFPHLIGDRVKHLKKMFIPLTYEAFFSSYLTENTFHIHYND